MHKAKNIYLFSFKKKREPNAGGGPRQSTFRYLFFMNIDTASIFGYDVREQCTKLIANLGQHLQNKLFMT